MPHQMWNIELLCAHCTSPRRSLSSKGVYNHVRLIMDVKDYYYTAAECMYCASSLGIAGLSTNCLKTISDYFQLSLPISMAATRPSCPWCDQEICEIRLLQSGIRSRKFTVRNGWDTSSIWRKLEQCDAPPKHVSRLFPFWIWNKSTVLLRLST